MKFKKWFLSMPLEKRLYLISNAINAVGIFKRSGRD